MCVVCARSPSVRHGRMHSCEPTSYDVLAMSRDVRHCRITDYEPGPGRASFIVPPCVWGVVESSCSLIRIPLPVYHGSVHVRFHTSDLPKVDLDTDRGTDFQAWHQQWLAYRSLSDLSKE